MGKRVVFSVSDSPVVIPLDCLGNLEREKKDQMLVTLQPLNPLEVEDATRSAVMATEHIEDEKERNAAFMSAVSMEKLSKRVKKMENIFFNVSGEEREILDPRELYTMRSDAAHAIITNIKLKIRDLEAVDSKNS